MYTFNMARLEQSGYEYTPYYKRTGYVNYPVFVFDH